MCLTHGFWIGEFDITNAQFDAYVKATGAIRDVGDDCRQASSEPEQPVVCVSWDDAAAYAKWLGGRLPTEAEWEYACRAGSTTKYCCGDGQSELGDYAWNGTNSNNQTHQVGQKKSNAWGLYDMHGNAWEWCNDWYGGYANLAAVDPTGPSAGSERVSRGGCWRYDAGFCRSAYRGHIEPGYRDPYLGFRVSRVAE